MNNVDDSRSFVSDISIGGKNVCELCTKGRRLLAVHN